MKRIIGALKAKLSRPKTPAVDDQSSETESMEEASMPDIYGDEFVATVQDLNVLDLSSSDADESTGFNPYDTAVLQKK
jgi:hypothetical protein